MTTNRLLFLVAASCAVATTTAQTSWGDIVAANPAASSFNTALMNFGLLPVQPDFPFLTVFAPLNTAFTTFEEENPELYQKFFVNPEYRFHLSQILEQHGLEGEFLSTGIDDGAVVSTYYPGDEFTFAVSGQGNETAVTITAPNSVAEVVDADNVADDGVVHFIDNFLLPSFVTESVLEVAEDGFSTLLSLLEAAELSLPADTPVTILAPPDAAFEALGPETLDFLQDPMNKAVLTQILLNHIVEGVASSRDLFEINGNVVEAVSGEDLSIAIEEGLEGNFLTVNNISVVAADILGSDGIIHVIDGVIVFDGQLPTPETTAPTAAPTIAGTTIAITNTTAPTMAPVAPETPNSGLPSAAEFITSEPDLNKTAKLFADSMIADTLCTDCPLTTFAPVDMAYDNEKDRLLSLVLTADDSGFTEHRKNFLEYHVSKEQDMRVFASEFAASVPANETADVEFEMMNGETVTLTAFNGTVTVNGKTVVQADIEVSNGVVHKLAEFLEPKFWKLDLFDLGESFPTYTVVFRLIKAVGIRSSLPGEYTLFVPDDAAFEKFGETNIQALENSIAENGNFLLNHVIDGALPLDAMENGMSIETVGEQFINIEKKDGDVFINGAKIIETNVLAKNGIAFGIDTVLEFEEPTDAPTAAPVGSTAAPMSFLGALALLLVALW